MASFPPHGSRSQGGLFQCGTCSQSYSRIDHLARHVRSHTQEKPYRCETCKKGFSRVDLLKRHSLLHTTPANETSNKRRRPNGSSTPLRVSKACEACAEHHLKCEDEKPCRRCLTKNVACISVSRPLVNSSGDVAPPAETGIPPPNRSGSLASMSPEGDDKALDPALIGTASEQNQVQLPPDLPLSPRQYGQDQVTATRPQSQYMDDYPSGLFTTDLPSGALTPSGLLGYGGEIDLDFSAIDLSFLSTYNTRVPFEVQTPIVSYLDPTPQTTIDTPRTQDENASHNSSNRVLQNSIWRFVPVPGVGGYSDQTDLSIAVQDQTAGTPESLLDVRKRATNEEVDAVARDKILAILFSQLRSHILPAPAFPSVMLLDKLIQFFLDGPTPSARNWIHTASFSPKKARPELLLAMAAAGAVLTPDRSLRKLGFAMQEVVRNHAPTVWEADNTLVRDLEMSQAYMLQLAIGLWSGSSRKVEIAESFQQPLLSMLRRGGRFKRSNYPRQVFGSEDEGFVLERKWRAWVEQESFKRLVYHLLGHDAQASMSLLVNPAVSYSEVELPLPESQDLWLAGSAKEWKRIYQANPDLGVTRIPSLTECVASPNLMQYNRAVIDLKLSCSSFLYAMWGMVWEYRKLARLFHTELNRSTIWDSRISLMTRYHELVKVFDYYRVSYPDESVLLLELVLMHLHMSLEEVQHFCGLESAEDTNTVHASIKEWADSKTARSAVWHAGQVVRGIRALPATHLRDFYAISLFHASLTLWTFGLASRIFVPNRENRREDAGHAADPRQVVYLDDEETSATYRYISLARGTPGLHDCRHDRRLVSLDDLTGVMNAMMQLMDRSDGEPSTPNSPLVENLLNVMGRIRDTAPNDSTTL